MLSRLFHIIHVNEKIDLQILVLKHKSTSPVDVVFIVEFILVPDACDYYTNQDCKSLHLLN